MMRYSTTACFSGVCLPRGASQLMARQLVTQPSTESGTCHTTGARGRGMSHTLLPLLLLLLLLLLLPFILGDEGDVALSSLAQGSHRALPMGVAGPMIGLPSRSCSTASSEVESKDELEDGEE